MYALPLFTTVLVCTRRVRLVSPDVASTLWNFVDTVAQADLSFPSENSRDTFKSGNLNSDRGIFDCGHVRLGEPARRRPCALSIAAGLNAARSSSHCGSNRGVSAYEKDSRGREGSQDREAFRLYPEHVRTGILGLKRI